MNASLAGGEGGWTLFMRGDEPAIFLVGLAMFPETPSAGSPGAVLLDDETHYEVPADYLGFLDFVRTPRSESELTDWLTGNAAVSDSLARLIESGKVRRIHPGPGAAVLGQFAELVLRPLVEVLDWPDGEPKVDGVVFIGYSEQPALAIPVSATLVDAMWNSKTGEDFVQTVERLAMSASTDLDEFAHEALDWLPGLLASGYAYFGPRAAE